RDLPRQRLRRFDDADKRSSCTSGDSRITLRARCPLVQWQDIGLWIREWWVESNGGNSLSILPLAHLTGPRMDGLAVPSHGLKLLSGTANRGLAEEISRHLGVELCRVHLARFADGELSVRIDATARG